MENVMVVSEKMNDENKLEALKQLEQFYNEQSGFVEAECKQIKYLYTTFKRIKFFKDNQSYFKSFRLCERCNNILPYGLGNNNVEWYRFNLPSSKLNESLCDSVLEESQFKNNDEPLLICQECYECDGMQCYRRNYVLEVPKINKETGLLE